MTRNELLHEIFGLMGRTKRTLKNQLVAHFEKLGLSPAELELLTVIKEYQPVSHKALAGHMHMTPGAISQLLEVLVSGEYVLRKSKPTDRRISYVSLSKRGERKLEAFKKTRQQMFNEAFATLSDEELAAYLHAQRKLIEWFEANTK